MKKNRHKLLRRLLTMSNRIKMTIKTMTLDALLLWEIYHSKTEISKT